VGAFLFAAGMWGVVVGLPISVRLVMGCLAGFGAWAGTSVVSDQGRALVSLSLGQVVVLALVGAVDQWAAEPWRVPLALVLLGPGGYAATRLVAWRAAPDDQGWVRLGRPAELFVTMLLFATGWVLAHPSVDVGQLANQGSLLLTVLAIAALLRWRWVSLNRAGRGVVAVFGGLLLLRVVKEAVGLATLGLAVAPVECWPGFVSRVPDVMVALGGSGVRLLGVCAEIAFLAVLWTRPGRRLELPRAEVAAAFLLVLGGVFWRPFPVPDDRVRVLLVVASAAVAAALRRRPATLAAPFLQVLVVAAVAAKVFDQIGVPIVNQLIAFGVVGLVGIVPALLVGSRPAVAQIAFGLALACAVPSCGTLTWSLGGLVAILLAAVLWARIHDDRASGLGTVALAITGAALAACCVLAGSVWWGLRSGVEVSLNDGQVQAAFAVALVLAAGGISLVERALSRTSTWS
jgi:hypothetical protein